MQVVVKIDELDQEILKYDEYKTVLVVIITNWKGQEGN